MYGFSLRCQDIVCKIIVFAFLANFIAGIVQAATRDEVEKVKKIDSHEKLIEIIETSEDRRIVNAAENRLRKHGPRNKKEFNVLVKAVKRDSEAKHEAYRALTNGGPADPEKRLLKDYRKLLRNSNLHLKLVGIWYVAYHKDMKSFSKLCRMLKERGVGGAASMALGRIGDRRAISYMIKAGSEEALVGLEDLSPGVAKALVEAIEKIPVDTKFRERKFRNLLSALGSIKNPAEKEYLLSQRDHERDSIKRAIWTSLAGMADEDFMDMFLEAALSGDKEKARPALDGLAMGGKKGLRMLERILEEHPELSNYLKKISIGKIGYHGNESHIPLLQKIAKTDGNKEVRDFALYTIETIRARSK